MLASPWSAASLYFSDCSQKHIFPWCYFRTLARAGKDMVSLGGYCSSPLRVMHNDFSFFRALIRQIDEICYRSATNSSFHLPQSRTNSEVISSNLLLNISPYCSYPTNTELSTSQIWFRPIACTASIAASLWLKCRFPTVRQFAPSNVSCC